MDKPRDETTPQKDKKNKRPDTTLLQLLQMLMQDHSSRMNDFQGTMGAVRGMAPEATPGPSLMDIMAQMQGPPGGQRPPQMMVRAGTPPQPQPPVNPNLGGGGSFTDIVNRLLGAQR